MTLQVVVGLNAVITAVTDENPRVLTVARPDTDSPPRDGAAQLAPGLPFGPLDPLRDQTLELGLRGWVREQTGIELGYAEQLYTFADRDRDPRLKQGGPRMISVAYLALVRETMPAAGAHWLDWYCFLPWEDWREGRPESLDQTVLPALESWLSSSAPADPKSSRRDRVDIAFGLRGAAWNWERVLDRYELLYEAGLVWEASRDTGALPSHRAENAPGEPAPVRRFGQPMILDHRRILATALDRVRGKLKYRPVVFELLPANFTLLQLQRIVEALAGLRIHKQNFRRLVENAGLVEGTGELHHQPKGRPAELFRFRREVLRERPAPGVGLPGL